MKQEISTTALTSAAKPPETFPVPTPTPFTSTIVIEPRVGWSALNIRELLEYRDLLYFMVWRDIKARYRQTALGAFWIVLQPVVSMVLYTIIFGWIAKLPSDGVPYSVFSFVGLLPWGFFTDSVSSGSGGLLGSKDFITKVYFPRLIYPLSKILGSLIDLFVSCSILVLLLLYYRIHITWGVVLIPLFLLMAAGSGLGFGLLFSGLVVKYRDFGNLVGYFMRAWMYAVPVVYSATLVPQEWMWLYSLNPMYSVIVGFRWALAGTEPPSPLTVVINAVTAVLLCVAGLYIFKRAERTIVDVL